MPVVLALWLLTLFLVPDSDPRSNLTVEQHHNPTTLPPRVGPTNDPQPREPSRLEQGTQLPQQEIQHHRNQNERLGVQMQAQTSALDGRRMPQGGAETNVIENHSRLQTPLPHRQELPFAFSDSPLPSLPGDIFTDASRFDEGLRDMDSRTDFYDNLNYVLSGSYE